MAKDKDNKKAEPKPRAEKYDAKLAVNGTLEQILQAAFVKDKNTKEEKK